MELIRLIKCGLRTIINKRYRDDILCGIGFYNRLPDAEYLKIRFFASMGTPLDLDNPRTFNEKLQWLKLYDRKPEYTVMVDKYQVRKHIADTIGEQYLIPLLGVWDDPDEIDFDALPNQFVLKCNHNSGLGMCICKDKSTLDIPRVRSKLRKGLQQNYYLTNREWPYKDVSRKVLCEEYMDEGNHSTLTDYKVLCFNGEPKLIEIHRNRFTEQYTQDYYDTNWNLTDFCNPADPLSGIRMDKPAYGDEMLRLSALISKEIPHLRVDWYVIDGKLYFSELTFFDGSGLVSFLPGQDEQIGEWLTLPQKTN